MSTPTGPHATLSLWVFEKNVAARRFYRTLDATECGVEEHETPDGRRLTAVRCEWEAPHSLWRNLTGTAPSGAADA